MNTDSGTKIYATAKCALGTDPQPNDNPVYGCAGAINAIVKKAIGKEVGGGLSTALMYECLKDPRRFSRVDEPIAGDIIISPTGTSTQGADVHGHVGIVGFHGVMSNNSEDGLFEEKLTLESWNRIYKVALGFPVYFFRAL